MLTYAFDLLYAIYEEQGYQATDIPRLILTNNLYGVEIDPRAGALAAFALTMKAREKYRRFLSVGKAVQPNICVLENIKVDPQELDDYMDKVGHDLFSGGLQGVVNQWEEADNFGSLIRPLVTDVSDVLELLRERQMGEDLFHARVHQQVLKALLQADYLSPKYHVVVANPPYMNSSGMNTGLKDRLKTKFSSAKADLMTCFMDRACDLAQASGYWGMINLPSWLFLSSFDSFREQLLSTTSVNSLLHLGRGIFGSDFGSVAFVVLNEEPTVTASGTYRRLFDRHVEVRSVEEIRQLFLDESYQRYIYAQSGFQKIPGRPIAYWVTDQFRAIFSTDVSIADQYESGGRCKTHNDERYVRYVWEVSLHKRGTKWREIAHGGEFRRWYGNRYRVFDWSESAKEFYSSKGGLSNKKFWSKAGVTCSKITSGLNSFRLKSSDEEFSSLAPTIIPKHIEEADLIQTLLFLNSNVVQAAIRLINPTLTLNVGDVLILPQRAINDRVAGRISRVVDIAKSDWNASEMSWDFETLPILNLVLGGPTHQLENKATELLDLWSSTTSEMVELETANNEAWMDVYGLGEELNADVPIDEVTLSCNRYYRYGSDKSESDLEALLLADTIREFISYAVGCMLGRYSLDKPGLILANQGETTDDYLLKVSNLTEPLDEDRAISEPDSVVLVSGASVACFSCGDTVPTEEAAFVISEYEQGATPLRGRPLIYCSNCAEGPQASSVTWQQPLVKFSVRQALDREWCEPNTLKKFISLAGCFGHRVPADPDEISFMPDDDNVIPLLDGDWFTDDISQRFKEFLKVTFGTEHYDENLTFLENALYPDNLTGKKRKTIRDYFLKEFYNHHLKLYKKRPIYWLFSSPKGTFNALIYMHRYRPDTVSVVLSYLRDFRDKLTHHTAHLQSVADRADGSKSDKTKALKQINEFKKQLKELDDYERTTLFPLAQKQIPIDLDDGVKVNYLKFGAALKKIPGLEKVEA